MRQQIRWECEMAQRERDEAQIELAVALCSAQSRHGDVSNRSHAGPKQQQHDISGTLVSGRQSSSYGPPTSPSRKAKLEVRGHPPSNGWRTPPETPSAGA